MLRSLRSLAIAATLALAGADAAEILVAHPGLQVDALDREVVKTLFLGKKRSLPDGTRVEVVVLAGGEPHQRFLRAFLDSTPSQFDTTWKRLVFTGQARMPTALASSADLARHVAANPGTLGYIDDATPRDGVKIIAVK